MNSEFLQLNTLIISFVSCPFLHILLLVLPSIINSSARGKVLIQEPSRVNYGWQETSCCLFLHLLPSRLLFHSLLLLSLGRILLLFKVLFGRLRVYILLLLLTSLFFFLLAPFLIEIALLVPVHQRLHSIPSILSYFSELLFLLVSDRVFGSKACGLGFFH